MPRATPVPPLRASVEHKAQSHPPQPLIPDMIGHAPGETIKGGRERGGNASPPGDSRVSRRIRPLALPILNFFSTSDTTDDSADNIPTHETMAMCVAESLSQ
eukprot:scaffold5502_cov115-Isochrysis_galbana.AAC.9